MMVILAMAILRLPHLLLGGSTNTLTLLAYNNIYLNADITALNGGLNLSAVNNAQSITSGAEGSASATGVTANISVANFNLLQGQWYQVNSTLPTLSVTNNFQIDSGSTSPSGVQFLRATAGDGSTGNPYMITDVYGLQGIETMLYSSFDLANNISASTVNWNSGAGFIPIGTGANGGYAGTFNGQGYTISNLSIIDPGSYYVGLFGYANGAYIENVGLANTVEGYSDVGSLVGDFLNGFPASSVTNVYNTGTVSGSSYTGGLIGFSDVNIINGYNSGTVNTSGSYTGGLVGYNDGTISGSYNSGTVNVLASSYNIGGLSGSNSGIITTSYNSGTVNAGNSTNVGGLSGTVLSGESISDAYNIGAVTGAQNVGGLVGYNINIITNSYSTGLVTSTESGASVGGFVGVNGGTISNSFWDTNTSNQSNGAGSGPSTGLTGGCFTGAACAGGATADLSSYALYSGAGWNISATPSTSSSIPGTTWLMFDGQTLPMLAMEWSTTITNAHQLQLAGMALGANYTLANNINLTNTNTSGNAADVWGAGVEGWLCAYW